MRCTISKSFKIKAVTCVVAMLPGLAAASELRIVSSKSGVGTKMVIDATRSVSKVKTKATVPAGVQTQVAGYALVNEGTCTFDGAGKWTVTKAPATGTISMGTETGPLADGNCPGVTFTFATISYTPPATGTKRSPFHANWNQLYQGVNYITSDSFVIKVSH